MCSKKEQSHIININLSFMESSAYFCLMLYLLPDRKGITFLQLHCLMDHEGKMRIKHKPIQA